MQKHSWVCFYHKDLIPRIIHYCWFGHCGKSELILRCIDSWRQFLPGFEIKEWNEDNFDVDAIPYTRDAYAARAYAFVSDYARFKILHEHGGLYFDTDVQVIRPLDDLIARGPFMALESDGSSNPLAVNPGLVLGACPGMQLYRDILDGFESLSFLTESGTRNPYSMIQMVTDMLVEQGLKGSSEIEHIGEIDVYPVEWFNPFDDATGRLHVTDNTRAVHWYDKSWMPKEPFYSVHAKRFLRRVFGTAAISRVGGLIKRIG